MSNIPLRRTTRTTRNTIKDNENANARPSRVLTRSKTLVPTTTDVPITRAPTTSKLKALGSATEKPVGKRKREALVEVTTVSNNNLKSKSSGTAKGKEKEIIEEPKPKVVGRPVRQSLRTIVPAGITAQKSSRGASVSTTASQTSETVVKAKERENTVTINEKRPLVFTRKPSTRAVDEIEAERVFKKRHTEPPARKTEDESQADADKIAAELADLEQESEIEAKAGGVQLWDDLDADDWDDPMMVSEYVAEVCVYLKQIEIKTLPDPDYMKNQPELDWGKRGILVDWILQVHARFNLLQETLFLFTNVLDRFLSVRPISLSKLQLVGITAFFIAAKFEETYAPSVVEIAYLADGQYTVDEILKAERYILKTLDWDLKYPGPMGWLRRGSKADDCEIKARTVGKYLMEIGCLEWRLAATLPSLLAAAALWLSRLVLGREVWTPNLEHYTTYSESELLPTANIMLNYILGPIQHESLYKKYAHKRYLKCSAFMRQWALDRWLEGDTVVLEKDLPALKEEIRLR